MQNEEYAQKMLEIPFAIMFLEVWVEDRIQSGSLMRLIGEEYPGVQWQQWDKQRLKSKNTK